MMPVSKSSTQYSRVTNISPQIHLVQVAVNTVQNLFWVSAAPRFCLNQAEGQGHEQGCRQAFIGNIPDYDFRGAAYLRG